MLGLNLLVVGELGGSPVREASISVTGKCGGLPKEKGVQYSQLQTVWPRLHHLPTLTGQQQSQEGGLQEKESITTRD